MGRCSQGVHLETSYCALGGELTEEGPTAITYHVSHVTCNLSSDRSDVTPVTCHLLPIACHLSPITCQMSPVTCQ